MLVQLEKPKDIIHDNPIIDVLASVSVRTVERRYQTVPDFKIWLFCFIYQIR